MLEALDAAQCSQEHVLDDIFGVGMTACVAGESPSCPAAYRWERTFDQNSRGRFITTLRPLQDKKRRIAELIGVWTLGPGFHAPLSRARFLACDRRGSRDNKAAPSASP